jgi:integrase
MSSFTRKRPDGTAIDVHRNDGVRKVCRCGRRKWPKCEHGWYFSYRWRGVCYRFNMERELRRRVKTRAEALREADNLRVAIRDGAFRRPVELAPAVTTPEATTFASYADTYLSRAVMASGKTSWKDDAYVLGKLKAFAFENGTTLGDKALGAVTEDDLELVLVRLRERGRSVSTRNKYVQVITAAFRWAVRRGYLTRSPISDETTLKRKKPGQRSRRLAPGEEEALLKVAPLRLYRLILAALETGCRAGELTSLQWRNVDLEKREITVLAEKSKTATSRTIPISARLLAVLQLAKLDPDGQDLPAEKYVFGDEVGDQVKTYKKAWETAVLVSHGVEPAWTATNSLDADSRAAFKAIDLHFHDLRHEAGSRWLEAGWPLVYVRDALGHADIKTTSTYLNSNRVLLQDAMRKLDEARALQKFANDAPIEQRPLCKPDSQEAANSLVM